MQICFSEYKSITKAQPIEVRIQILGNPIEIGIISKFCGELDTIASKIQEELNKEENHYP